MHGRARDRPADGHLAVAVGVGDAVGRGEGRRLRRPVAVDEFQPGEGPQHLTGMVRGQRLAAHDHRAQQREDTRAAAGQLVEERGGEEGDGDAMAFHVLGQVLERGPLRGAHDHGGAVGQRSPHLEGRGVERHRRVEEHPVAGREGEVRRIGDQLGDRAVRDGDALGTAGGARGEHDERRGVRAEFGPGDVAAAHQRLTGQRKGGAGEPRRFEELAVPDGQGRAGVGGQCLGTGARMGRVERYAHGARPPQRELGDDGARRAGHQQRHRVTPADAVLAQMGGERAGRGDELCVGEGGVAVRDGQRLRGPCGMPCHEGRQAGRGRGPAGRRGGHGAVTGRGVLVLRGAFGGHGAFLPGVGGVRGAGGHLRLLPVAGRRGGCRRAGRRRAGPAGGAVRERAAAHRSPSR